jgi:hypothetical protein
MQSTQISDDSLGYAKMTTLSTAKNINTVVGIPAGCTRILLQPETQAIRIRDDGTNPTAGVGFPIAVGTIFEYNAKNLTQLVAIEQVASTTLHLWFFGTRSPS